MPQILKPCEPESLRSARREAAAMRNLHTTAREEPPLRKTRDVLSAESLVVCPTLCDPMDHGPPGSSVHGILQARILDWVAMSFSETKETK